MEKSPSSTISNITQISSNLSQISNNDFKIGGKKNYTKMKSSFFGPPAAKRSSGFFGPSKGQHTWIDDRPDGEPLSEFYEIRKKIIFKRINVIHNENEFAKFILDSQTKANNTIKQEGLFFTPRDVFDWAVTLKENISNYFLVIYSYLNAKKNLTALHLFFLMNIQNREKVEKIFEQIKKNFKNMSNSNRIGKFYPSIIKIFLQVLSVMIKFSVKFNKLFYENFYLKKYLLTIDIVKNTVINRFITFNSGNENDYKNLGRFFFFDCFYKQAIYSFHRYESFNIIIEIFNNIFEYYKTLNESSFINLEQILLMKSNYNLGLILYTLGNNQEALSKFNEAISYMKNINYYPYIISKFIPNNKIENKSNINNTNIKSIIDKSTLSTFNIDESVEKIIGEKAIKKRSISTRVDNDSTLKNKEILFGLKEKYCSVINFGKNKIYLLEKEKNVETYIKDQMYIEIELMMAELELNRNNYEGAFYHINDILNIFQKPVNISKKKLEYSKTFKELDRGSLDNTKKAILNNKRVIDISDLNRRRICFILDRIDKVLIKKLDKNQYYNSRKYLEEIQDISSYESDTSRSKNSEKARYKNKNKNILISIKDKKLMQSLEKFFIFICGLSLYQLKILNEFQPDQSQKRDELPILFPNQFKDCLNFEQRLSLNYLDTMSLSRCVILLDSKKEISPYNLNYALIANKNIHRKNSEKNGVGDWTYSQIYLKKRDKYILRNKKERSSLININNSNNISMNLNTGKKKYGLDYGNNNKYNNKKNLKKKMFIQGQFEKFIEEDEDFNYKIEEIIMEDDDKIKINRSKIYKVMNELEPKEKELIMNDKSYVEDFVKNIKKKLKRSRSSYK